MTKEILHSYSGQQAIAALWEGTIIMKQYRMRNIHCDTLRNAKCVSTVYTSEDLLHNHFFLVVEPFEGGSHSVGLPQSNWVLCGTALCHPFRRSHLHTPGLSNDTAAVRNTQRERRA